MLYEVITMSSINDASEIFMLPITTTLSSVFTGSVSWNIFLPVFCEYRAVYRIFSKQKTRITSYNVCYTKLLRFKLASEQDRWFLSNRLCGMSLYVDRFCDNLQALTSKLDYMEKLGINLIHLMPLFESPEEASDGGYAVSDFRSLSQRFGT